MNKPVPTTLELPKVLEIPPELKGSEVFKQWTGNLTRWMVDTKRALEQAVNEILQDVNNGTQGVGPVLPVPTIPPTVTATLTLTNPIHPVNGTGPYDTITAPPEFSGPVWLLPLTPWTTVTGGNIALASTAVVNRVLMFVRDSNAGLWFPSY